MKAFGKELNPTVIKITLILLFLSTLFPPFIFRPPGYSISMRKWGFLFNPPGIHTPYLSVEYTIDVLTLCVEYVLILILMCIVYIFVKDKEKVKNQKNV